MTYNATTKDNKCILCEIVSVEKSVDAVKYLCYRKTVKNHINHQLNMVSITSKPVGGFCYAPNQLRLFSQGDFYEIST